MTVLCMWFPTPFQFQHIYVMRKKYKIYFIIIYTTNSRAPTKNIKIKLHVHPSQADVYNYSVFSRDRPLLSKPVAKV